MHINNTDENMKSVLQYKVDYLSILIYITNNDYLSPNYNLNYVYIKCIFLYILLHKGRENSSSLLCSLQSSGIHLGTFNPGGL